MVAKNEDNMSLIKWSPMMEPFGDFDRWLEMPSTFAPAVNIREDENNVFVETPLPGIDPEKVNIAIENDVLTIEGSEEKKTEVEEKNYYRKEVRSGSFHRAVALPTAVKSEEAKAEYAKGILKISMPKEERAKPKKVRVEVKE
jgi:HSP20 family protein